MVALGACACLVAGPRIHRAVWRRPWQLIAVAAAMFVTGLLIRPWAVAQPEPLSSLADLVTLSGYAVAAAGLLAMLQPAGHVGRHALTDGIIIGLGSALLSTVLLILPTAEIQSRPALVRIPATIYPVTDIILLFLLLNLGFTTASSLISFRLFAAAMISMFVGDVASAWLGTQDVLTTPPLLSVPYLVAYTLIGASAMHPSMPGLSAIRPRMVQPWSPPRLALIIAALLTPAMLLVHQHPSMVDHVAVVVAGTGLSLAMLVRALSAVRDYTRAGQVLRHQATHDLLTGLPNRVLLAERIQTMLESPRPAGCRAWVTYVNLDDFHLVNDHWGHDTGDQVLAEVARRLVALADDSQVVARIGGDEFAIAGRDDQDPTGLARRVQQVLREPVQLAGMELVVTSSTGVVSAGEQATAETMLRDADTAVYRAKSQGRDRCAVFDESMRAALRQRLETELALRQALPNGQLWVAFQPQLDPGADRLVGAEALLRWRHPERGEISPVEFIPIAEQSGLITEIGAWVLHRSLQQLVEWRAEALLPESFSMSVNASARQITDDDLHLLIDDALQQHRVPGGMLTVEITESVLMTDTDEISPVLLRLRELGLQLSVDDFGTGYSSLSYLSRFPVNEVKIDRAFISGLGHDAADETIVRAVVAMASGLNLTVVAEGVETIQQRDSITQLGIQRAQGWLWGKPVHGAEFRRSHLLRQPSLAAAPPA